MYGSPEPGHGIPRSLFTVAIAVAVTAGCGSDGDAARPATFGEACEQAGTIVCAFEARGDACAGQPDMSSTCVSDYKAGCCSDDGTTGVTCSDAVTSQYPTFDQYTACADAIEVESCTEVQANVEPEACKGVAP